MQTRDHRALAVCFINSSDSSDLKRHAEAFLLGCVEPDYNPLTYLRGFIHYRAFRGHNAENAQAHILKCLEKFQSGGPCSAFDYFTLGTLIHYVADAFTFPHNAEFQGGLRDHVIYESKLHQVFSGRLSCTESRINAGRPNSLRLFFENAHGAYSAAPHSMETDCDYILQTCMTVFRELLNGACEAESDCRENGGYYENSYHHGLVSAGH